MVQEGLTSYVGGGTAVFVDVAPTSDISVHFRVAELADGTDPGGGDGGVVGGGCNNVPAFTSAAQPPLAASCGNCHGAGGQTNGELFTFTAGQAFMIRDGKVAERIRDVTIGGNVFDTLKNITGIAGDFHVQDGAGGCGKGGQMPLPVSHGSPHIRIKDVVIGGR